MKHLQNVFDKSDSSNENILRGINLILETLKGKAHAAKKSLDDYIDEKTAAQKLGKTTRTLYEWRKKKMIDFLKIGRTIYYRVADIKELFDKFPAKN
jgi:hypothetical protein